MFDSWNRSRKHRQKGTLETWLANRSWLENRRSPGEPGSPRVDTAGHGEDTLDPGSPPTNDKALAGI